MYARFVAGLRAFLREEIGKEEARSELERRLAHRGEAFLQLVEATVFQRPKSPYAALFRHAGIDLGDLERLVGDEGLEDALDTLHEAGVYVTIEEFKGKRPIVRPGLTLDVTASDFDNPLLIKQFEGRTGGSGGEARSLTGNLELMTEYALVGQLFFEAYDFSGRARGNWLPPPPGGGIQAILTTAKIRQSTDRWFIPLPLDTRGRILTATASAACKLFAAPFRWPEHVPPTEAIAIARWIAETKRGGRDVVFVCTPSSGVRICALAQERGLDVSRTFFIFGGEPYTEAKAAVIEAAGCWGISPYGMTEIGWIGLPCPSPTALDDVHLSLDKVAVRQRPRRVGAAEVDGLVLTSLHRSSPKLLVNVESGDYGVLEERECGCPFCKVGLRLHFHTIRSYEKLTSEGVTFFGDELVRVIEQVLPVRFGGGPTDYQFVEEEEDGLPKVRLLVSPGVGEIDEREVIAAVLESLRRDGLGHSKMAELWKRGETIEVVRAEPNVTAANKVLPLHVAR